MNYKNLVIEKLAQAIASVSRGSEIDATVALNKLNLELNELAEKWLADDAQINAENETLNAQPVSTKEPLLFVLDKYVSRDGMRHVVPKGFSLRVGLTTNRTFVTSYNNTTGQPCYTLHPKQNGTEYVDIFLSRRDPFSECDYERLGEFLMMLRADWPIKTCGTFGDIAMTDYFRFGVTHAAFCECQGLQS